MKEINIGNILLLKRRQKGKTQDDIASYIGVSKASVSKWERSQSYPDITFLPQLASYFDISIDELIGYDPQMTKEDIKKLYHRLSSSFASSDFEQVIGECRQIIKKYYSCYPLLLQMAILLTNHYMLAKDKLEQDKILSEIINLCKKIRNESDDVWLAKEATFIESLSYLILEKPEDVLSLLGESVGLIHSGDEILSQAYQMIGNVSKAKEVTQISNYQHLLALVGSTPSHLMLYVDDRAKSQEILERTLSIADIYSLRDLHPNVMAQIYFAAAQVYSLQADREKALDMLEEYVLICTKHFFPFSLHGDLYFDKIDGWIKDFDLGSAAPRDEKIIRNGMIESVKSNPIFSSLLEEKRYKDIIRNLELNLGGS